MGAKFMALTKSLRVGLISITGKFCSHAKFNNNSEKET